MSSRLIMFDVESGERADLIVKSNSSDGRANRYWLRGSCSLDASYWDRYSHNVTDTQWMLIFCERNCPPRWSRFPLNTNEACEAEKSWTTDGMTGWCTVPSSSCLTLRKPWLKLICSDDHGWTMWQWGSGHRYVRDLSLLTHNRKIHRAKET